MSQQLMHLPNRVMCIAMQHSGHSLGKPERLTIDASLKETIAPIALLVQHRPPQLEQELTQAILDELHQLGCQARVVHDGDSYGDAQTLWLISDAVSYRRLPAMLLSAGAKRPKTLLWQMHPLAPPQVQPDSQRLGLAAARMHHYISAGQLLDRIRPCERLAQWTYRHLSAPLYQWATHRIKKQPQWPWTDIDWRAVRGMMERQAWIQRGLNQRWLDCVCVSSRSRQHYLKLCNIDAHYVPIGSHPVFGSDLQAHRDIDVLFLGRIKRSRRVALLNQIEERLTAAGRKLTCVQQDCFGKERTQLLNRARVVLNLHKVAWDAPWMRFVLASACGAAVVTEPLMPVDSEPFAAGVHYVEADPAQLADAVIALLADEPRRQDLVQASQNLIHSDLTLNCSVVTLSKCTDRIASGIVRQEENR